MNKSTSQTPNPALKDLEILVGNWDMELSNATFLPSPSATAKGHVTIEWLEGGAFLVMYMEDVEELTRLFTTIRRKIQPR